MKLYCNAAKIKNLDELITTGMLNTENKCWNSLRMTWGREINEVLTQFRILKISLSSLHNWSSDLIPSDKDAP